MAEEVSATLPPANNGETVNMTQTGADSPQGATDSQAASEGSPESAKRLPTATHVAHIEGALRDIIWSLSCVSLPMLILTATFIGLVYTHKVSNDSSGARNLFSDGTSSADDNAYYINYSATRLITVSSWTSTVTSFASTFVMALCSYPLAKSYLKRSEGGSIQSLPTAYQLRLIIGLIGGGLGALWSWLQYCSWRKRSQMPKLLWLSALSLLGTVMLSFAILAVDTWLHVTTATVIHDTLKPVDQPTLSYGRSLGPSCYGNITSVDGVCIGGNFAGIVTFESISEASRTLLNLSTTNGVLPCTVDNRRFAYLTAAEPNSDLDFQSKTFAVGTVCTPASKHCHLQATSWCPFQEGCWSNVMLLRGMSYDCGPYLYGDLVNNTALNGTWDYASSTGFFLQSSGRSAFSKPFSGPWEDYPNPFYFALGARVPVSNSLATDPEAVQGVADFGFIFSCEVTFYEMTYKIMNGSFADASYSKANRTLAGNFAWSLFYFPSYTQNVMEAGFIGGAQQSNNSQQFADFLGQRFSETALSMVSGVTIESRNLAEQTRERLLVTRLQKAPFFTLIVLNLLYALLGIILAVVALANQPRKTRHLQSRLSIGGLVAALLEPGITKEILPSQSNSGIEGAFAEFYNDGTNNDNSKISVSTITGTGNAVFEKTFVETHDVKEVVTSSTEDDGRPSSHATRASLSGERLTALNSGGSAIPATEPIASTERPRNPDPVQDD
ncbi:hypothetical protein H2200_006324 [Cladophialophora chaetospira]|uniref:Uncharacterized protein n=1 Tax=Cladophialophora chaetospira TaxID=386627 RepID=A0AA38XAP7_9EURO|nr:hypothetical protein H2200_006324 [Cladophialophora chaetospira]